MGICLADPTFQAVELAALPCSFNAMVHVCFACLRPRDQVYGTSGGDPRNGTRLELAQIPDGSEPSFQEILAWHDFPLVRYQPRKTPTSLPISIYIIHLTHSPALFFFRPAHTTAIHVFYLTFLSVRFSRTSALHVNLRNYYRPRIKPKLVRS